MIIFTGKVIFLKALTLMCSAFCPSLSVSVGHMVVGRIIMLSVNHSSTYASLNYTIYISVQVNISF